MGRMQWRRRRDSAVGAGVRAAGIEFCISTARAALFPPGSNCHDSHISPLENGSKIAPLR